MSFGGSSKALTRQRFGKLFSSLFVILVLTIGCCVAARTSMAQTLNRRQLARLGLTAAQRSDLVKRLQLFVEYEKTRAYDKQFELLAQDHLASYVRLEVNEQSYVKFKQETEVATGRLLELKVRDIKRMPDREGGFNFVVEVKLQKDGRTYSDTPIFAGYLVNDTWYFSMVYVN
jgi:hypothetical protein